MSKISFGCADNLMMTIQTEEFMVRIIKLPEYTESKSYACIFTDPYEDNKMKTFFDKVSLIAYIEKISNIPGSEIDLDEFKEEFEKLC